MSRAPPSRPAASAVARDAAARLAEDKARVDTTAVKATGAAGEPGNPPRSYFDVTPYTAAGVNPAGDEALRDLVSLRPHFGGGQLLGEKPWDPSLLSYIADKRDHAVRAKINDLVLAAYDPLDPQQRSELDRKFPGLVQSKQRVFEQVLEQRQFINDCALRLDVSADGWARLVRILGGGEALMRHPLDEVMAVSPTNGAGAFSRIATDFGNLGGLIPGLFSFFTAAVGDRKGTNIGGAIADTREQRKAIAALCLHHFPRFITGGYSMQDRSEPRQRIAAASDEIVSKCEAIVAEMVPLGDVANRYISAGDVQQSSSVGPDLFSNAFNRAAPPAEVVMDQQ